MRRPVLLTCLTLASATFVLAPVAVQATHSWGGYHWARDGEPFTLTLGDNVDERWDESVSIASADWSTSTKLDTTVLPGSSSDPLACNPTPGRVEVCNAGYGETGWIGIASISASGDNHITASTVKLNDTYFDRPGYNNPDARSMVACQEIGHALGLHHQDEAFNNPSLGTCMDYTNDVATNHHPNQHDFEQLDTIYGHLDETMTVGSDAGLASQPSSEFGILPGIIPSSWGIKIGGSRAEGESTYVQNFDNGTKVFTHVTWVGGPSDPVGSLLKSLTGTP